MTDNDLLIEVQDLRKYFPIIRGFMRRTVGHVKAIDGVSFNVRRGETLALVGESGCGKTTTGRCIMRAIEPTAGKILFHKDPGEAPVDLGALKRRDLRLMQRFMGMVFQDPYSSLNPRMTVLEIVGEPFITRHVLTSSKELEKRVAELLRSVHLDPSYMRRYPHAFSGGQRQRIAIARALALNPSLVVADEPLSALDVSVQAQILTLLRELQSKLNLTYLFITHNLAVVEYSSDRVAVMYVGKIVEFGDTAAIFSQPRHPYTEALLSAVPMIETDRSGRRRERIVLQGDVADPANVPPGCAFHPRCLYRQESCQTVQPKLVNVAGPSESPHYVSCHFAGQFNLHGVSGGQRANALTSTPVVAQ